jgi:hypothetical protein
MATLAIMVIIVNPFRKESRRHGHHRHQGHDGHHGHHSQQGYQRQKTIKANLWLVTNIYHRWYIIVFREIPKVFREHPSSDLDAGIFAVSLVGEVFE